MTCGRRARSESAAGIAVGTEVPVQIDALGQTAVEARVRRVFPF